MCFSAAASFAASAILIPAGVYSVNKLACLQKAYWALAMVPMAFGIQQIFEGWVWLEILSGNSNAARLPALGYLFFSHLFWPAWIPFTCYTAENSLIKRKIYLAAAWIGALYGMLMYLPLWFHTDWLTVKVSEWSIGYYITLLSDPYISSIFASLVYVLIVLVPLLSSSSGVLRWFGVIILSSLIASGVFFNFAFISIWCYFSAVLSLYTFFALPMANRRIFKPLFSEHGA